MKIIINLNTSWNIYNFRLELIDELRDRGHEVIAISPKDSYTSKLIDNGIKHYHINVNQRGTNPIADLKLIFKYRKLFSDLKPDIILSYTIKPNIYGNVAAQLLGIPTINNISGLGTMFIKGSISSMFAKLLYKFSLQKSKWVFFQNKYDLTFFLESNIVKKTQSSIINGSGVNTSIFKTNRKINQGKKFLFPARLIKDKGIYEFLKAAKLVAKEYSDVEFLLAGELGYNNTSFNQKELNKWIDKNIKYLGNSNSMKNIYKDVDVVVLPSYREGLSKTLIEAAAMSLPIITTNVPGCKDVVIDNFNGLLVKDKSVNDLKDKMIKMINFPNEKRLEFGKNGRKLAIQKFDSKIIIKEYINKISNF